MSYADTAHDWRRRWKRALREDARLLVVLVPFGPVGFVYDVQDTEPMPGATELPRDVYAFPAAGSLSKATLKAVMKAVEGAGIRVLEVDEGGWHAGRKRNRASVPRAVVSRL